MPYIKKEDRKPYNESISRLALATQDFGNNSAAIDGHLNFIISEFLCQALDLSHRPKYSKINLALGVLECVKQELYRRIAAPYEDNKIDANGDLVSFQNFAEFQ
jgi:hypothetical protein